MHMDRAIFDLHASIEATSLYILICAILDQKELPSIERARAQWNSGEEALLSAVQELMRRGVLDKSNPLSEEEPLRLNPKTKWDLP